jgi:hypothetical protein
VKERASGAAGGLQFEHLHVLANGLAVLLPSLDPLLQAGV